MISYTFEIFCQQFVRVKYGSLHTYFIRYTPPMRRESILMIAGILTALSPFSGLPLSWRMWLLLVLGIVVSVTGYTLREQRIRREEEDL